MVFGGGHISHGQKQCHLFNKLSFIQLPSQVLTKALVWCGSEKGGVQARQLRDKVEREWDIIKAVNPYIHPEVQKVHIDPLLINAS